MQMCHARNNIRTPHLRRVQWVIQTCQNCSTLIQEFVRYYYELLCQVCGLLTCLSGGAVLSIAYIHQGNGLKQWDRLNI